MRRRGLALMVLALMLVVMMDLAGLARAQPTEPPAGRGCNGMETARGASVGRQGPPEGKGHPRSRTSSQRPIFPRLVAALRPIVHWPVVRPLLVSRGACRWDLGSTSAG